MGFKREGLLRTQERVEKAFKFLTHRYDLNPDLFNEAFDEMIILKDIEVYFLCEHHMLPFFGKAHIAYISNDKIVGLRKLPRFVDTFARSPQVEEGLTSEIRDCIYDVLEPKGVAVVNEVSQMYMQMRVVQKQNSTTTSLSFTEAFEQDSIRKEFINLLSAN